jgi:Peptidase MA superfamily
MQVVAPGHRPGPGPGSFERVEVGDVLVMVDSQHASLGTALGQAAAVPHDWLGIGRVDAGRLVLVVADTRQAFAEWSHGRVPAWGAGVTFPGSHVVIIRLDAGDPFETLRHELAHVVLHRDVPGRVPLWFDEGYAVLASGEFDRMAQLRLNLAVALGHIPETLDGLDAQLRADAADAEAAYALSGSAVAELARRNPTHTLKPMIRQLEEGTPFDQAVEITTGLNDGRFDVAWRQAVRSRYNLALWFMTGGAWLLLAFVLIWAAASRRRRDEPRRRALDVGWPMPPPEDPDVTIQDVYPQQLDRSRGRR